MHVKNLGCLIKITGISIGHKSGLIVAYYTMRLEPDATSTPTFILPWDKNSYKRLPMDMAALPGINEQYLIQQVF